MFEIIKAYSPLTMLINKSHNTSNLLNWDLTILSVKELIQTITSNKFFGISNQIENMSWIKII